MAVRYKRSDKHPSDAQLVFWRYNRDKETWISRTEYERRKAIALAYDKVWKQTPKGKETSRRYFSQYMKRPRQKARLSKYYKQPHVRARYKKIRDSNPVILARREARLKWRAERAVYRESEEYKAIIRKRNIATYRKRRDAGKMAAYYRNRRKTDLLYRLKNNIRSTINKALRVTGKSNRCLELLGCSLQDFKRHLESQFTVGMTWENYRRWEIDHRVPLSSFNLADPEQQKLAFNFHNCRPMWKTANRQKSDFVEVDGRKVRASELRKIIPFKAA